VYPGFTRTLLAAEAEQSRARHAQGQGQGPLLPGGEDEDETGAEDILLQAQHQAHEAVVRARGHEAAGSEAGAAAGAGGARPSGRYHSHTPLQLLEATVEAAAPGGAALAVVPGTSTAASAKVTAVGPITITASEGASASATTIINMTHLQHQHQAQAAAASAAARFGGAAAGRSGEGLLLPAGAAGDSGGARSGGASTVRRQPPVAARGRRLDGSGSGSFSSQASHASAATASHASAGAVAHRMSLARVGIAEEGEGAADVTPPATPHAHPQALAGATATPHVQALAAAAHAAAQAEAAAAAVAADEAAEAARVAGNFGVHLGLSPAQLLQWGVACDVLHTFADESPASPAKFSVTAIWAVHFHALRELYCGSQRDFVHSLSRSEAWAASGGKSGASFERSADRRLVVKHVSRTEWDMFNEDIAPAYFAHMAACLAPQGAGAQQPQAPLPTLLVKILGAYKVVCQEMVAAAGGGAGGGAGAGQTSGGGGGATGALGALGGSALAATSAVAGGAVAGLSAASAAVGGGGGLGGGGAHGGGGQGSASGAGSGSGVGGGLGGGLGRGAKSTHYVIVMEDLFHRRRILPGLKFDLKGKSRAQRRPAGGASSTPGPAGGAGGLPSPAALAPGELGGGVGGAVLPLAGAGGPVFAGAGLLSPPPLQPQLGPSTGAAAAATPPTGAPLCTVPAELEGADMPAGEPPGSGSPSAADTAAIEAWLLANGFVDVPGLSEPQGAAAGPGQAQGRVLFKLPYPYMMPPEAMGLAATPGSAGANGIGAASAAAATGGAQSRPGLPPRPPASVLSSQTLPGAGAAAGGEGGANPFLAAAPSSAPSGGSTSAAQSAAAPGLARLGAAADRDQQQAAVAAAAEAASSLVLLDGDLLAATRGFPLPLSQEGKRLLDDTLRRDVAFLAGIKVVDYSVLLGIDAGSGEVVLGIIDYMRRFDLVKRLEHRVKAMSQLATNIEPTVIQPERYMERLLRAMDRYTVAVPNRFYGLAGWAPQAQGRGARDGGDEGAGAAALYHHRALDSGDLNATAELAAASNALPLAGGWGVGRYGGPLSTAAAGPPERGAAAYGRDAPPQQGLDIIVSPP
jgi:hypothetical protein